MVLAVHAVHAKHPASLSRACVHLSVQRTHMLRLERVEHVQCVEQVQSVEHVQQMLVARPPQISSQHALERVWQEGE